MALEEVAAEIVLKLGSIALWLQGLGIAVALWIILQISNWLMNRKRLKRLEEFSKKIESVENKLDKLLKKVK